VGWVCAPCVMCACVPVGRACAACVRACLCPCTRSHLPATVSNASPHATAPQPPHGTTQPPSPLASPPLPHAFTAHTRTQTLEGRPCQRREVPALHLRGRVAPAHAAGGHQPGGGRRRAGHSGACLGVAAAWLCVCFMFFWGGRGCWKRQRRCIHCQCMLAAANKRTHTHTHTHPCATRAPTCATQRATPTGWPRGHWV
jgi:hypothetical protein